jgi:hypothetical protein
VNCIETQINKLYSLSIFLLLIFPSFGLYYEEYRYGDNSASYGFIIPLPQDDNTTRETLKNSLARNLINDLLRENITIYWSNDNFSALSKTLHLDNPSDISFFKKGDFIIPFSGEDYQDILISSIICDYNSTHELNHDKMFNIEAYILMEKLEINVNRLNEPKIVQYLGENVRYGWPTYLEMADAGGFLNYEFLVDGEAHYYLNNDDFNIYVWPYFPDPSKNLESFYPFIQPKDVNAVRRFIRNGGGFVGTCYGAYAASSGLVTPFSFFSVRYAYNPNLSKISPSVSLSLSASIMHKYIELFFNSYLVELKVVDENNPVFYGVDDVFYDYFRGPVFIWLGKDSHAITIYQDVKAVTNESIVNDRIKRKVIGRPCYINSTFGMGKLILFSTHPDFMNDIKGLFKDLINVDLIWLGDPYYGRRIVHNSIFHVSSETNIKMNMVNYHTPSFIYNARDKTMNLSINETSNIEFNYEIKKLKKLSLNISDLRNISIILRDYYSILENSSILFSDKARISRYKIRFCELYNKYINNTIQNLSKLQNISYMLYNFDHSIIDRINNLRSELKNHLSKAENHIINVTITFKNFSDKLQSEDISILHGLELINKKRDLLGELEIGLKYIPQLFFETLKLVRHSWYNYEANTAHIV